MEPCHQFVPTILQTQLTASSHRSINRDGMNKFTERGKMDGELSPLVFTFCSTLPGSQSTHSLWGAHTLTKTHTHTHRHTHLHTQWYSSPINLHYLVGHLEIITCFLSVLCIDSTQRKKQIKENGSEKSVCYKY